MTAQITDKFTYNEDDYSIVGMKSEDPFIRTPFNPLQYDLDPVSYSTACWRGYQAHFMIKNDKYIIDRIDINLSEYKDRKLIFRPDPIPDIEGRIAIKNEKLKNVWPEFEYSYLNMDLIIPFSGNLLIGTDFVGEFYVHMGFHPAWKYRKVLELKLEKGIVVNIEDKSVEMKKIRDEMRIKGEKIRLKNPDKYKPGEWIEDSFTLDY